MKLAAALVTLVAGSHLAAADTQYVMPGLGDSVVETSEPVMAAPRFTDVMKFVGRKALDSDAKFQSKLVNTHVLYLNNCQASGGCAVKTGDDDARVDTSSIGHGTLSAYPNDGTWGQVVSCVTATMSRFNIQVTDVDPGSADHFEVMIAGTPQQLGLPDGVGGIASVPCQGLGSCDPYLPNALVFAFANTSFLSGDPTFICSVAAQEIAHAWTLDHVVEKTDPMTYNDFNGMHQYQDGMKCGSDCQGGQSPFNLPCTGSGGQATHACFATNTGTQNDVQTILAIFGSSNAVKPTVAITAPTSGSTVPAGFDLEATCTVPSPDTITQVDFSIDGHLVHSSPAAPFKFTTAASLASGTHKLDALCTTSAQAQASATATVTVGSGCTDAASCPNKTDICLNNACVAGSGAAGGLGATCTGNAECTSSLCADNGTNQYCVIPCDLNNDTSCPSGYQCVNAGTMGVCFPGGDGGGCSTSGGSAPAFLGLGTLVAIIIRRRKRS